MPEEISKEYLKEKQYKSTQYLEARIKIHQFTKNKIGFSKGQTKRIVINIL